MALCTANTHRWFYELLDFTICCSGSQRSRYFLFNHIFFPCCLSYVVPIDHTNGTLSEPLIILVLASMFITVSRKPFEVDLWIGGQRCGRLDCDRVGCAFGFGLWAAC
jgi:hypothetical protein